ncbi:ATPase involved in chromosome partitioning [Frankia canadensis]|uniref:ATPase involved in chromosome partitioning n=1 Tax=Frankia canadensis TaxID=1836972 RepID=A0A2I2L0J8_9ACTN|nr:MinD/ParA family protein [Frankia canadensis]SNQ51451.1 ATPase involved in chromosome partitioning [Frankia canadensis]SOU58741.1 ATPase involved in chromosome partitioning [Frankia canadensis]
MSGDGHDLGAIRVGDVADHERPAPRRHPAAAGWSWTDGEATGWTDGEAGRPAPATGPGWSVDNTPRPHKPGTDAPPFGGVRPGTAAHGPDGASRPAHSVQQWDHAHPGAAAQPGGPVQPGGTVPGVSDTWPSIRQPELDPAPAPAGRHEGSGGGRMLPIETRTFDPLLDQYPLTTQVGFGQAYPPPPPSAQTRNWHGEPAGPHPAPPPAHQAPPSRSMPAHPAPHSRSTPPAQPAPPPRSAPPVHPAPPPRSAPPPHSAPPAHPAARPVPAPQGPPPHQPPPGAPARPDQRSRPVDPRWTEPMPAPPRPGAAEPPHRDGYHPSVEYPAPPPPPGSVSTQALVIGSPLTGPGREGTGSTRVPSWLRDPDQRSAPGEGGATGARHHRIIPHEALSRGAAVPAPPVPPPPTVHPPNTPPGPELPPPGALYRTDSGEPGYRDPADASSRSGPAGGTGRHRAQPPNREPRPQERTGRSGRTVVPYPPYPGDDPGPQPGADPYWAPHPHERYPDGGDPAATARYQDPRVHPPADPYRPAAPRPSGSQHPSGTPHPPASPYPTGAARQSAPPRPPAAPTTGAREPGRALLTSALLPPPPQTASRGWRKLVYQVSAGAVNPGPSPDEVRDLRLAARIRTPLLDCHRIAVMSIKGGVGKTTTTVAVGSTLASLRGDRVVAIDANPDRGTLGSKVPRTSAHTVRELLEDAPRLHRYVDVRKYLSQADSRLEVLASANDPELSDAFGDAEYRAVDDLLQRHYSILLTDCGTGILHSAMHGVLELADTLVIVSSATADGGSSASATLDWLDAHGYAEQVREAVAVISMFHEHGERVDVDALSQHFESRTRRVVRVPFDPHLADGGRIVLSDLRRETREAYREIAGAVAERFGQERGGAPR